MASRGRAKARRRLLPGAVETGLRRLLFGGYGIVFVAIACAAWASLATWSVHDPSLNNATRALPSNWLGSWGAVLADITIQMLGLAAIILFLPLAAWGWHLVFHSTPDRRKMRLLAWPASVILLAAAFAALPQPKSWPLPNGLGGILGDFLMAGAHVIGPSLCPGPPDWTVPTGGCGLLRRRSHLSRARHDDAPVRLRHLDLAAHRAVGAAERSGQRVGQCLARRGYARRHAYRREAPPPLPPPRLRGGSGRRQGARRR